MKLRTFIMTLALAVALILIGCGDNNGSRRGNDANDADPDFDSGAGRVFRNSSRPSAGNQVWDDYQREKDRQQRRDDYRRVGWPLGDDE